MLTTGEQQELREIEEDLRDAGRGFARRLTVLQDALRWAAPGRGACLPVLAAALLWLVAAVGRLLLAFAEGGALLGPAALMPPDGAAWPGWESGQGPGLPAGPAPGRPRPRGTDLP